MRLSGMRLLGLLGALAGCSTAPPVPFDPSRYDECTPGATAPCVTPAGADAGAAVCAVRSDGGTAALRCVAEGGVVVR